MEQYEYLWIIKNTTFNAQRTHFILWGIAMDGLRRRMQAYRIAKNPSLFAKKHVTVRRKMRHFPLAFLGFLRYTYRWMEEAREIADSSVVSQVNRKGCASSDGTFIMPMSSVDHGLTSGCRFHMPGLWLTWERA